MIGGQMPALHGRRSLLNQPTVIGGADYDTFYFADGQSDNDTIINFQAGAATDDVIELAGFGTALDEFSEVIAAASQVGSDVVIDFGGGESLTI